MARAMGFGMGAASLLAAAVLVTPPTVKGDGRPVGDGQTEPKTDTGDTAGKAVDRRIRIAFGGGSFLGIRLQDVDKDEAARLKLSEERGAIVKAVEEGSPAQKAGLREGDVVVRYDGQAVTSAAQLARLVRETPVGRAIAIDVVRGGSHQTIAATVGEAPGTLRLRGDLEDLDVPVPPMPHVPPVPPLPPNMKDWGKWGRRALLDDGLMWAGRGPRKLGLEYQEIEGQLARYFKLSQDTGLLVTEVEPEGPAAKGGLKAGDVIVKFAGQPVSGREDLERAVERAEAGKEVVVTVQREGRPLDLKVTLGGHRRHEMEEL
jgi:serine protease Do